MEDNRKVIFNGKEFRFDEFRNFTEFRIVIDVLYDYCMRNDINCFIDIYHTDKKDCTCIDFDFPI